MTLGESKNEWRLRVLKEEVDIHRDDKNPLTLTPSEIDWLIERLEEAWEAIDDLESRLPSCAARGGGNRGRE